jgi:hypothetical protein
MLGETYNITSLWLYVIYKAMLIAICIVIVVNTRIELCQNIIMPKLTIYIMVLCAAIGQAVHRYNLLTMINRDFSLSERRHFSECSKLTISVMNCVITIDIFLGSIIENHNQCLDSHTRITFGIFISFEIFIILVAGITLLLFKCHASCSRNLYRSHDLRGTIQEPILAFNHTLVSVRQNNIVGANMMCAICIDQFAINDTITTLPCFHEFHSTCIDPWLFGNITCPTCRHNVTQSFGALHIYTGQ